jgi:hypothetical protein
MIFGLDAVPALACPTKILSTASRRFFIVHLMMNIPITTNTPRLAPLTHGSDV